MISCPTCGRTRIDLFTLAEEVERKLQTMESSLKVAVMGCVVNGPGEAREADIGIAGGHGVGILFKKGEIYKKVAEADLLPVFLEELEKLEAEHKHKQ
jgi:(E)-4-hydroxy-3-methylbut-2-enyl-diphosphate synthase